MSDIDTPMFVRYDNGGVVSFGDVEEAEEKVAWDHLGRITGAWDRCGRALQFGLGSWRVVEVRVVEPELGDAEGLRAALLFALRANGERVDDDIADERLILRASAYLRLQTKTEMWTRVFPFPF